MKSYLSLDKASWISRTHEPVRVGESYDNTNFFRLFCALISFAAQSTISGMLDSAIFIIFLIKHKIERSELSTFF